MKSRNALILTFQTILLSILIINKSLAGGVEVIGSIEHTLHQKGNFITNNTQSNKVIQLMEIQLSDAEKELIEQRAKDFQKQSHSSVPRAVLTDALPSKVQLGMNNVPVLDQGAHGTCVTFAITGALDATMKKGDYISQLCHLQLGSYMQRFGYGVSGWNGSYGINVINQIQQYGIVNTVKQQSMGCGGLTVYPTYSAHDDNSFIEPAQFSKLSEWVFGQSVNWSAVPKNYLAITLVKRSLYAGNRVVFGTLLPHFEQGIGGAMGKYHAWATNDTWILTADILRDARQAKAAHEMIITGYDDNAEITDSQGKKHKGLFTVRNSWGPWFGDQGDFYMSYDYFNLLAFQLYSFSPAH